MFVMTTARCLALSREADLAFVTRLLAEEGIVYRFENDGPDDADDPAGKQASLLGHRLLILAISAKAGLAVVAGQDIQFATGEGITLASGQDSNWAVGGAGRLHTGQAIGMLAGAIMPGTEAAGKGLTLIAGKGDIEVQAQADRMQVAAKNDVSIQSQSAHIDWAAAKKITLSTAGGANITIEGGNITVQPPGTINILAATKSFVGPERVEYPLPTLPMQVCKECLLNAAATGGPFALAK